MPTKLATCCAFLIVTTVVCQAQSTPAPAPGADAYVPTMTFDVASIRQSHPDRSQPMMVGGGFNPSHSGNLTLTNCEMHYLLGVAYHVNFNQIVGLHTDFRDVYNVTAKLDEANNQKLAGLSPAQIDLEQMHMLQALLADRFHLKAHWEDRPGETYDLVVAKPGKLSATVVPPTAEELKDFGEHPIPPLYQGGNGDGNFEYIAHAASSADIAAMLTMQFGKPVNDKTNLTGKYYFDLKYHNLFADDRGNDDPNVWPPMDTALHDQLGLKVVPSHGNVRVLVIDHLEPLTEN
jgi:uncharacterized protein (TIGR03435 family)